MEAIKLTFGYRKPRGRLDLRPKRGSRYDRLCATRLHTLLTPFDADSNKHWDWLIYGGGYGVVSTVEDEVYTKEVSRILTANQIPNTLAHERVFVPFMQKIPGRAHLLPVFFNERPYKPLFGKKYADRPMTVLDFW